MIRTWHVPLSPLQCHLMIGFVSHLKESPVSATGAFTFVLRSHLPYARLAGRLPHGETGSAIDDTLAPADLDAEWLRDRPRASVDDEEDNDEEDFDDDFDDDDDLDDDFDDDDDFDEEDEDYYDDDPDEGDDLED